MEMFRDGNSDENEQSVNTGPPQQVTPITELPGVGSVRIHRTEEPTMAGDWIPMRLDLIDDPSVVQIATTLGMEEYAVIGRLLKLWGWANRHLEDGAATVTLEWVDAFLGVTGFARAMTSAGWLEPQNGAVSFPNFDRWNSQGAKRRIAKTAQKQAERARVADDGDILATKRRQNGDQRREEKRIEERALEAGPDGFSRFWKVYPRKVAKQDALKAWQKLRPSEAVLGLILEAVDRQRGWLDWIKDGGKFIPYPASWLNGRRWEDQPPEPLRKAPEVSKPYVPLPGGEPLDFAKMRSANGGRGNGSRLPEQRPPATA